MSEGRSTRPRRLVGCAWLVALGLDLVGAIAGGGILGCRRRTPEPSSADTGELQGMVATENDAPLGSVSVVLGHDPPDRRVPFATARTDVGGEFRMRKLLPGAYRLEAKPRGYLPVALHVEIRPAQISRARLILSLAVSLAGTVEDQRGAAVPLARVLAFPVADGSEGAPPASTSTADSDGHFRIGAIGVGAYRLLIEAPGLGASVAGPLRAPDEMVRVVLSGISRRVMGRVLRDGQPAVAARVRLAGDGLPEVRYVDTDARGGFVFGGLGQGNYALRADAGGWVSSVALVSLAGLADLARGRASGALGGNRPSTATEENAARREHQVALALVPGRFLRGTVVDDQRRGVPGAEIRIEAVPATGLSEAFLSDGRGAWSSGPLPEGKYRLDARKTGFVCTQAVTAQLDAEIPPDSRPGSGVDLDGGAGVESPAARSAGDIRVEVVRTGEVLGRIVDARGNPISGARVRNQLAQVDELGVILAPLPMAAEAAAMSPAQVYFATGRATGGDAGGTASAARGASDAVSDAEGRFRMTEVPPGRFRLEIAAAGSVPLRTPALALRPGQQRDVGDVRVQKAIALTGRVLDLEGNAIAGARLAATPDGAAAGTTSDPRTTLSGNHTGLDFFAVSDESGAFSLPLTLGTFRVTVSAVEKRSESFAVQVEAAVALPPVTWRLSPVAANQAIVIIGQVKDGQGRPLAGARVALAAAVEGFTAAASVGAPAIADAGGHYRLEGRLPAPLPIAAAAIQISHPLYPVTTASLSDVVFAGNRGSLDVTVPVPGALRGEVHERLSGGPVPEFHLQALGPGGARAGVAQERNVRRARRGGRSGDVFGFRLDRLLPGQWTLRVVAPGFQPTERVVDVPAASTVGELSVGDLRIELARLP